MEVILPFCFFFPWHLQTCLAPFLVSIRSVQTDVNRILLASCFTDNQDRGFVLFWALIYTKKRSLHSAKHNICWCLGRQILINGLTAILPWGLLTISENNSPVQDFGRFKTADEGNCNLPQLAALTLMQVGLKMPRVVKVLTRRSPVRRRQWGPDFFFVLTFTGKLYLLKLC